MILKEMEPKEERMFHLQRKKNHYSLHYLNRMVDFMIFAPDPFFDKFFPGAIFFSVNNRETDDWKTKRRKKKLFLTDR